MKKSYSGCGYQNLLLLLKFADNILRIKKFREINIETCKILLGELNLKF